MIKDWIVEKYWKIILNTQYPFWFVRAISKKYGLDPNETDAAIFMRDEKGIKIYSLFDGSYGGCITFEEEEEIGGR